MKLQLTILLSLVLILSAPAGAWALDASASASARAQAEAALKQARQAAHAADQLANYKTAATKYINDRIASLQKVLSGINDGKLTPDQKNALTSNINTAISGLQALQTKINADTDVATIKADVQSIFTSYRVYMVQLPKVEGLRAADRMSDVVTRLQAAGTKIKALIDKAAAKGVDTSQANAYYNDFLTQTSNAQTQINTAIGDFNAMQVSDTSGASASLQAGKSALQNAKTDLMAARKDLQSIVPILRSALLSKQATGSATPATGSATH